MYISMYIQTRTHTENRPRSRQREREGGEESPTHPVVLLCHAMPCHVMLEGSFNNTPYTNFS